ncbi:MAG: NAD(P)-binding domain-containing protein [bacterium]|nr:NAD(P)-binding domain-containing protein [bacterium]
MQLGFVGTGTMGDPMVRCLLEAGHTVTVNDRRRGSQYGSGVADATGCGTALLHLRDDRNRQPHCLTPLKWSTAQ